MAFTKAAMQEELLEFMSGFVLSIERMYGVDLADKLGSNEVIRGSTLWKAANEFYDFGMSGLPVSGLGHDCDIDAYHADVETFLHGIYGGSMDIYFSEDNVINPTLTIRAMKTAIARHVLEGGERYTDYGAGEHGWGEGDWGYLTLAEVALLADMDERSVRNAANPKVADPLKTVSVGKRSLVTPEEAKRWLGGRKGFIPMQSIGQVDEVKNVEVSLPEGVALKLKQKAASLGLSVSDYIDQLI